MRGLGRPDTVLIIGGQVSMGSDRHYPEQAVTRLAEVATVQIDHALVTILRFRRFIEVTYSVIVAGISPDPKRLPASSRSTGV